MSLEQPLCEAESTTDGSPTCQPSADNNNECTTTDGQRCIVVDAIAVVDNDNSGGGDVEMRSFDGTSAPTAREGDEQVVANPTNTGAGLLPPEGGVLQQDPKGGINENRPPIEGHASARSTLINVICNVVGGGVLALPTAFHQSSMMNGIILLFAIATITCMNLYFIVECAEHTQIFNYRALLIRGLGRRWGKVVDIALFFFPTGALIAYARVVADAMPPVLEDFFGWDGFITSHLAWFLIGGVIFFVFSCRRNLAELKITSIFGIATICYAVLVVIIRFFDGSYDPKGRAAAVNKDFSAWYFKWDIFKTIPIIAFSLSVHNNAPAYYEELQNRSPKKMYKVLAGGHSFILLLYLLMAMFGLLTFGPHITKAHGNILDAYSEHDVLMNTARLGMFVHFACVFPILQMASRRGLNNLFIGHNDLHILILCAESFGLVVVACVSAAVLPNIDIVLAFNGALFGSIIMMMAPSALFLTIKPPSAHKWAWFRQYPATFSIIFGAVVGVTGVCVTIDDVVNG